MKLRSLSITAVAAGNYHVNTSITWAVNQYSTSSSSINKNFTVKVSESYSLMLSAK